MGGDGEDRVELKGSREKVREVRSGVPLKKKNTFVLRVVERERLILSKSF